MPRALDAARRLLEAAAAAATSLGGLADDDDDMDVDGGVDRIDVGLSGGRAAARAHDGGGAAADLHSDLMLAAQVVAGMNRGGRER